MQKKPLIIYVDDEIENLKSFRLNFVEYYDVEIFDNPESFFNFLKVKQFNDICVILADYRMPKIDGVTLLVKVKEILPSTRRIIISAYDDSSILIDSINKAQIHKFILKPWERNTLLNILEEQIEFYELTSELNKKYEELKMKNLELIEIKKKLEEENKILKSTKKFGISLNHKVIQINDKVKIIVANPIIQQIYNRIERLKDFFEILFLTGERGVGKKTLVKYILYNSKKFQKVKNFCILDSFIYKEKIVNELMKLLKKFENEPLMVYITNIEEIPKSFQKEIYIILSERQYQNEKINLDEKLIVLSSTKNLEIDLQSQLIEELLYFLLPFHINIPPLRFRKDELPFLINYFVNYYSQLRSEAVKISEQTLQYLIRYKWPGNIDELKTNIKSAILLADTEIIPELFSLLPNFFDDQIETLATNYFAEKISPEYNDTALKFLDTIQDFKEDRIGELDYDNIIDEFEKYVLKIALDKADGNKAKAATLLNLKPGKFLYKTKYLGL